MEATAGLCQKFVRFYLFFHFKLFLPMNIHPFTHVAPLYLISFSPFTPSPNHWEDKQSQFKHLSKTGISTCEALRQAPSPIWHRITRLHQATTSSTTPPQTYDETLYLEVSSPRGLPTTTIPHNGMKRQQVAGSESVPDSPTSGRHLKAQMMAHHWWSWWPSPFTSLWPYSCWTCGTMSHPSMTLC